MAYCNTCESNPCTCVKTTAPSFRSTHHPIQNGITKEEFGLNLYETIKTIGGILAIDQHRANAIHRGEDHRVHTLMVRRKALQATLAQQLPLLTDSEMGQVLEKYPFVTGY